MMKKSLVLMAVLIFILDLTGCARNDINQNNVVKRNQNAVQNNINNNNNNRSRMRVAEDAAKKIADLPEVDNAYVIVTNNNAYVAVKLSPTTRIKGFEHQIAQGIELQIAQKVKSTDPDIDNVYVSENPDFYERMSTYVSDIRKGRPITGFFNEFAETIRRVFPKAK